MLIDYRHFQARNGDARVGISSGSRRYSPGAHGRSAWIAARERAPFCHHGSSTRSDPPPDADARPHHRGSEEGTNIGAVIRTENIKRAHFVASAARQKRQAKLLRKEEECASLRQQAQSEASRRRRPVRCMAGRRVVSLACLGSQPRPLKPALRKEVPSFRSAKSVSWGQL
jgi:hypothetical protein